MSTATCPVQLEPPAAEDSQAEARTRKVSPLWLIAWSTGAVAVIVTLVVIYYSRAILFPVTLALVLNLVAKPLVIRGEKAGIPSPLSSILIVVTLMAVISFGITALWYPASSWIEDFPEIKARLAEKLRPIQEPVQKFNKATAEVEKLAEVDKDETPFRVTVEQPGISSFLFNTSGTILATVLLTITLLYFLLAGGDDALRRLVSALPTWHDKKQIVHLTRTIQETISRYFITISLINLGLGFAIGSAMWILGLSTPVLWGGMAFFFNYIPFIGAIAGALIVFVVALLQFDLAYAFLAPLLYILINILEANFVTPSLVGKSVSLNPVVILVWLTLWGWMWGVGGVFLAIPLLVIFKVTCDHCEALKLISNLLEHQSTLFEEA